MSECRPWLLVSWIWERYTIFFSYTCHNSTQTAWNCYLEPWVTFLNTGLKMLQKLDGSFSWNWRQFVLIIVNKDSQFGVRWTFFSAPFGNFSSRCLSCFTDIRNTFLNLLAFWHFCGSLCSDVIKFIVSKLRLRKSCLERHLNIPIYSKFVALPELLSFGIWTFISLMRFSLYWTGNYFD